MQGRFHARAKGQGPSSREGRRREYVFTTVNFINIGIYRTSREAFRRGPSAIDQGGPRPKHAFVKDNAIRHVMNWCLDV